MGGFNQGLFNTQLFGGPGGGGGPSGAIQVSEIIYAGYRNAGILLAPGRTYSPSELSDGIEALNTLVDAYDIDPLVVFSKRVDAYNLIPRKQTYTIGIDPTGATVADFNVVRPVRIHEANIITQQGGGAPIRVPMGLPTVDGWSQIRVQQVPTTIPLYLYDDYAAPLSTLYFYPYPTTVVQVELYTWQQFQKFVSPTDAVLIPQGYLRMLKFNLAIELAARNPQRSRMSPLTVKLAADSLADVQRHNAPSPEMSVDPALLSNKKYTWSYLTGDFTTR